MVLKNSIIIMLYMNTRYNASTLNILHVSNIIKSLEYDILFTSNFFNNTSLSYAEYAISSIPVFIRAHIKLIFT